MDAPEISQSTREERQRFISEQWKCLADCDLCGKCSVLHGRDAEQVFASYIEGNADYMALLLALRGQR